MSASLKIYGVSRSRAFRTFWCVEELGVDYEQVQIGFTDGTNKTPAYLAINPNGRVPAIDDGGFTLWESLAINLYLAKKHGTGSLYPASATHEALIWQWSFWTCTEVEKLLGEWGYNTIVLPPAERDPKKAADAVVALQQPLAVLDAHLAKNDWLVPSGGFSIADLNLASTMFRAHQSMDLGQRTHLKRWLAACFGRPAAKKALAMRGD